MAYITREPQRLADDSDVFVIQGERSAATPENDCCLEFQDTQEQRQSAEPDKYPPCPDCGGAIVWAEAGGVPGSRRCVGQAAHANRYFDPDDGCGSQFADSRYHAASTYHICPKHPAGIR